MDDILKDQPKKVRCKTYVESERILLPNIENKNEIKNKLASMEESGDYDVEEVKQVVIALGAKQRKLPSITSLLRNGGR